MLSNVAIRWLNVLMHNAKENTMNRNHERTGKTALRSANDLLKVKATGEQTQAIVAHAYEATRSYERARGNLALYIENIREALDDAVITMNEGRCPNELGILQGNGPALDRLCGELARTHEAAVAAQNLLKTFGIL
jgi:hypothetical protein